MIISVCDAMLDWLPRPEFLTRAAAAGYDGVELLGEPSAHPARETRRQLDRTNLRVTGLTAAARLSTGRDLSHPDPRVRRTTIDHFQRCVDYAHEIGCPVVGVALTAVGRHWHEADPRAERDWAVEGLRAIADHAAGSAVRPAIEVLNRYTSASANTPSDAVETASATGSPSVGLSLDLFHLATEVHDPAEAVATPRLWNVQVAERTREAPGTTGGCFGDVVHALTRHGYRGALALEAFPPGTRPFRSPEPASRSTSLDYLARFPRHVRDLLEQPDMSQETQ